MSKEKQVRKKTGKKPPTRTPKEKKAIKKEKRDSKNRNE
ncbi:hypothetical protein SAMN04487765_3341 [Tenacibaculum sp. MAR_2010_89]|nr:hypothetical protein SAMN04487765_3341 [Tenacibaculum sp. MAR_2010_89]